MKKSIMEFVFLALFGLIFGMGIADKPGIDKFIMISCSVIIILISFNEIRMNSKGK